MSRASLAFLVVACAGHSSDKAADHETPKPEMTMQIQMPVVPDSLSDPADRADFILAHFWDSVDFDNHQVMADSIMIEQGISDYISIMDYCSPQGIETGVNNLLDKASASSDAYAHITGIAERYLWDSESPFRSERYYSPFVKYALKRGGDEAIIARSQLEDIKRNAPGSVAPDFTVLGLDGNCLNLRTLLDGDCLVALMFYEPGCEHCEKAIVSLASDPDINSLLESGRLRFVAIYIGDEYDVWKDYSERLPKSWIIGIDRDHTIDDHDLYIVRSTPSFYLIGRDGNILLKDSNLSQLYQALLSSLGEG